MFLQTTLVMEASMIIDFIRLVCMHHIMLMAMLDYVQIVLACTAWGHDVCWACQGHACILKHDWFKLLSLWDMQDVCIAVRVMHTCNASSCIICLHASSLQLTLACMTTWMQDNVGCTQSVHAQYNNVLHVVLQSLYRCYVNSDVHCS